MGKDQVVEKHMYEVRLRARVYDLEGNSITVAPISDYVYSEHDLSKEEHGFVFDLVYEDLELKGYTTVLGETLDVDWELVEWWPL